MWSFWVHLDKLGTDKLYSASAGHRTHEKWIWMNSQLITQSISSFHSRIRTACDLPGMCREVASLAFLADFDLALGCSCTVRAVPAPLYALLSVEHLLFSVSWFRLCFHCPAALSVSLSQGAAPKPGCASALRCCRGPGRCLTGNSAQRPAQDNNLSLLRIITSDSLWSSRTFRLFVFPDCFLPAGVSPVFVHFTPAQVKPLCFLQAFCIYRLVQVVKTF